MSKVALSLLALGAVLLAAPASAKETSPVAISKTAHGRVFVNDKGMTLYTFAKDAKGQSNCTGLCAAAWPPVAAAGDAKPSGRWSIVKRDSGGLHWAYKGRPLYSYAVDVKPGDTTGEGVDGTWHMAKP